MNVLVNFGQNIYNVSFTNNISSASCRSRAINSTQDMVIWYPTNILERKPRK